MSEKILFVNGIDTSKGGAGSNSLKTWTINLREGHHLKLISLVPSLNIQFFDKLLKLFYYFPFSFFKLFRNSNSEYFYKISFFDIIRILWLVNTNRFDRILISHHSIFYLKYFLNKTKRILIIHDLVSLKGSGKRTISSFERKILKGENLLIQSSKEQAILKEEGIHAELISCFQNIEEKTHSKRSSTKELDKLKIGLIADWRRDINLFDLKYFIEYDWNSRFNELQIELYGFGSERVNYSISSIPKNITINSTFTSFKELKLDAILVPNYSGAGIKLKTVESLLNDVIVIGTEKSIEGLNSIDLKALEVFISFDQISSINRINPDFISFKKIYHENFKNISEAINQLG